MQRISCKYQCRLVKAEGLIINSVGHRPANWNGYEYRALKGRN